MTKYGEDKVGQRIILNPANDYMAARCRVALYKDWHYHQCRFKHKYEVDGVLYCGVHHPDKVTERRRKSDERADAYWAQRKEERRLSELPLEALREIAKGELNDPAGYAAMILEEIDK